MLKSFWWDYKVSNFLFQGLTSHSIEGFLALCVSVASMAFLFEFLRYLEAKQRQKELELRSKQLKTICSSDTSTLLSEDEAVARSRTRIEITKLQRGCLYGADISIWFVLLNLGYLLMLSIMAYNGWFFISAVVGGGLGYFVFGQMFMKINLQNCEIIRSTWCTPSVTESECRPGCSNGESTPALEASASTAALTSEPLTVVKVKAECH